MPAAMESTAMPKGMPHTLTAMMRPAISRASDACATRAGETRPAHESRDDRHRRDDERQQPRMSDGRERLDEADAGRQGGGRFHDFLRSPVSAALRLLTEALSGHEGCNRSESST